MSYYHELNLTREPFSNSPDPDFFYRTQDRVECLNLMEVHIRLKRGLCVLLGEVGTGKTTLCRQLLIEMQEDAMLESYLLLDPQFRSTKEFLQSLHVMITGADGAGLSEFQLKEGVKNRLFDLTQNKGKTVVLLIDEGQRLRHDGIELLREILNYETNNSKLLQIVIFAQNEFKEALHSYPNFADRISTLLHIGPFVYRETVEMIRFRIRETQREPGKLSLFSHGAIQAIHKHSGGYPRKIVSLCHRALLQILIDNKTKATSGTIRKITSKKSIYKRKKSFYFYAAALVLLFVASVLLLNRPYPFSSSTELKEQVADQNVQAESPQSDEAAPPIASAPEKVPNPPAQEPALLGDIRLSEDTSLGLLISQVYGSDRKSFRKEVQVNNPGLAQAEMLHAGMRLHFPPILQTPGNAFTGMCWIELASYASLQGACDALHHEERYNGLPVALLPSFTPSKGLRFAIVLKQVYASEHLALGMLQLLPAALRSKAKIVRNWGEHAILYTTPDVWPRKSAQSAGAENHAVGPS